LNHRANRTSFLMTKLQSSNAPTSSEKNQHNKLTTSMLHMELTRARMNSLEIMLKVSL
jgi:hypothetical protein